MNRLELSTSPNGGVFDSEKYHGPVEGHVYAVFGSVSDLRAMKSYEQDSAARESVGAGWAERTNVVAVATGVEIADGVGEELIDMTYGDHLGGLRAPVNTEAILRQVEELRQDTAQDKPEEVIDAEAETAQPIDTEGARVIDFTEAQKQKALLIKAQESIDSAYKNHQNAA
ncbi:hypothetical protein KBB49_03670 [Candidatus Saccharibacteria bacterium]|nr:hypothetical protein [Candidatus Saccharibacteria bacterium]